VRDNTPSGRSKIRESFAQQAQVPAVGGKLPVSGSASHWTEIAPDDQQKMVDQ